MKALSRRTQAAIAENATDNGCGSFGSVFSGFPEKTCGHLRNLCREPLSRLNSGHGGTEVLDRFLDETNLRTAKNTESVAVKQGELPVKTSVNS